MGTKGSAVVSEDKWEKEYRLKHTFEFREAEAPEGFNDLDLDETVTIVLKGKITGLEQRKNIDGVDLSTFTIKRSSLTIEKKAPVKQMHEALGKEKEKRRI